jgi:hypothetical protein
MRDGCFTLKRRRRLSGARDVGCAEPIGLVWFAATAI